MKGRGTWGHCTARNRMAKTAGTQRGCVGIYRAPDVRQGIQSRALLNPQKAFQVEDLKWRFSPLLHFIKCVGFSILGYSHNETEVKLKEETIIKRVTGFPHATYSELHK